MNPAMEVRLTHRHRIHSELAESGQEVARADGSKFVAAGQPVTGIDDDDLLTLASHRIDEAGPPGQPARRGRPPSGAGLDVAAEVA